MWEYLGLLSPAVRYIYWKLCLNTRPASAVPAVHQLKRPDPDLNDGLVISPGAQLRGTIPWRWIPLTKNYANWTKDIELPQRASYFFSFSFFFPLGFVEDPLLQKPWEGNCAYTCISALQENINLYKVKPSKTSIHNAQPTSHTYKKRHRNHDHNQK